MSFATVSPAKAGLDGKLLETHRERIKKHQAPAVRIDVRAFGGLWRVPRLRGGGDLQGPKSLPEPLWLYGQEQEAEDERAHAVSRVPWWA